MIRSQSIEQSSARSRPLEFYSALKITTHCLLVISGAMLVLNSVTTEAATPSPQSPSMEKFWVAEQLNQNGVPMAIEGFKSGQAVEAVLDFYRLQWREPVAEDLPGFVESRVGEWQLISRLEQDTNTVVQVKPLANGGSEGFISTVDTSIAPMLNDVTQRFPKPESVQIMSSTESHDGDITATTIVLVSSQSVEEVVKFYQEKMSSVGWSLTKMLEDEGGSVLFFKGQGQKADLAIASSEGKTHVVATIVGD